MRVSKATFRFICAKVAPVMAKRSTSMRYAIPLEKRVCIALHRLATCSTLEVIGDLYGCTTSTTYGIVIQFCAAIKQCGVHDMYIRWPSESGMAKATQAFKALHGISFVIGDVDGLHIPIIAPRVFYANYFNRKGFYSILLQLEVTLDCRVWDYDVGWTGAIHDSVLFSRSALEQHLQDGSGDLASQLSQARRSDLESQLRATRLALNEVQAVSFENANDIVRGEQSGEAFNGHESVSARASGTERRNNLAWSMYREFLRRHGHDMFSEENNEAQEDINEMVLEA
ncbi:hypothetical protein L7F22_010662 [Adiantum nelumboides]|nr:hypothetical protein [Adiantum nelumboides]